MYACMRVCMCVNMGGCVCVCARVDGEVEEGGFGWRLQGWEGMCARDRALTPGNGSAIAGGGEQSECCVPFATC